MPKSKSSRSVILVVDDHEENIKVLANILSFMGYDLIPAMTAKQAFSRLEHTTPDLILLDLILPDVDGITVCQRIQDMPALQGIPIIFLSASDDKNLIVKALESGGVDYITKPFNKAELISRVRTHLALKNARDHLAELAADKDELLRMLAHDLKNHVAGVQMGTSLLLDRRTLDASDERSTRILKNVFESSVRMLGFIKTFLANHAGVSSELEVKPVDLWQVIDPVVTGVESLALAKEITIHLPDVRTPHTILANEEGAARVLENLLANSIKFCSRGAEIRMGVEVDSRGRTVVAVSDTGPGFSEDDATKIFQRYTRLSAQPTGGEPSTGLGLFIVKKMMTAMGGSVELKAGPGAVFHLTFAGAPTAAATT